MFITQAYAQATAADSAAPSGGMIIPFILIFVVMYFLMIRPQMKRQKEHQKMVSALGVGDEVILNSGVYGKISKISDSILSIEIAPEVNIQVQRGAIGQVLPKGTIKSV